MKKTIYLFRSHQNESYANFKHRIFELTKDIEKNYNPKSLKVVLTEKKPPRFSVIPFQKKKIAAISIKIDTEISWNQNSFAGSFDVSEALPVAYQKNWADKTATPGVCLLTLFNKKSSIDNNLFLDRWHQGHTPLSLKIHPLWHYNRNVVERNGNNNLENWDGIVEEHFKRSAELLKPWVFFGNPISMIPNMIAVYFDTKSFIDYTTMEPYLAAEYYIKSE